MYGQVLVARVFTLGKTLANRLLDCLVLTLGTSTLNLVTIMSTPKEQPFYVGMTGFVYGTGCILGPIVGGSLADSSATWRWVSDLYRTSHCLLIDLFPDGQAFYLNLVIFGVMSPIYLFLLPALPRQTNTTFTQKMKSLDWLGTILTIGLYVSFTMAFSFGGAIWAWSDGRVIASIVIFGILTITFGVTQYCSLFTNKTDRLFPLEFLRNPQLILLYICMACGGAALFVSVYYIPLFFLFVHGDSGVEAAVRLLPFICLYVTTILICGAAMGRTGYHMVWYLMSGILMTCGGALMYTVRAETSAARIYGYGILLGLGMTTTQAGYAIGPRLVKADRVSEVIQFLNISQGQSQLIGLTIASAMFQSITFSGLMTVLEGTDYSNDDIRAAIAGARSTVLETTTPVLRDRCIDVIVRSVDDVWVLVIAAGALFTVCSCFLTRRRF